MCRPHGRGVVTGTGDSDYGCGCGRSATPRHGTNATLPTAPSDIAASLRPPACTRDSYWAGEVSVEQLAKLIGCCPTHAQLTGDRPWCHPPDDTATAGWGWGKAGPCLWLVGFTVNLPGGRTVGGVLACARRSPRGPGSCACDGGPRPGKLVEKKFAVTTASLLNAVVTNTRLSSLFLQWAQPETAGWGWWVRGWGRSGPGDASLGGGVKAAMSSPVSPGLQSGRAGGSAAGAQNGKDKTGGASAGISRCMAPGVSRAQEQGQRSIETALRRVHG